MKAFRISASIVALTMLSVLAACGGGGGGGGVNPPGGGGGGGGGPTPTPAPTGSPTSGPTQSPTPVPTQSPTPAPSGAIAANANINAAAAYDGPVANPQIGVQNGKDGWFTSGTTTSPNDPTDGDTSTGGTGPSTPIDTSITCSETSEPTTGYHVHAFIGIIASNGTALPALTWESSPYVFAVPDAVGMLNPIEPTGTVTNGGQIQQPAANGCFYQIHFHAESGLVHFEDPTSPPVAGIGANTAKYSLQNVLDVWGMSLSSIGAAIGQSGSPTIIFGLPTTKLTNGSSCPHGCDEVVSYNVASSASAVTFSRHSAVWLIYGAMPSGGPPAVYFQIEN